MANPNHLDLIVAATENTTGAGVPVPHAKAMAAYVWGTFDEATVTLQASPDGQEWFDVEESTFTEKTWTNVNLSEGWVRGTVTNAGATTNVNLVLRPRAVLTV